MSSLHEPGGPVRRSGAGEAVATGTAALLDADVRTADALARATGVGLDEPRSFLRRFAGHPLAVVGAVVLLVLVLAALLAPVIAPGGPSPDLSPRVLAEARQGPSWDHLFGTDKLGRDQFDRVLYGLRISLVVGLGVAAISVVIGVAVGALAGWRGGWVDSLLMRFTDLFLVIPALVVLLVVASNPDPSFFGLFHFPPATDASGMVIILAALGWMPMARIVRGEFLSLREREYVDAARAAGASGLRIVFTHLLPNCLGPIVVFATLAVGITVLNEAVLSFLGAGIQYPSVSLGQLIADAEDTVGTDLAYLLIYPGLVLFVLVLAVNLVGDGLRDAIDPHRRRTGERSRMSANVLDVGDLGVVWQHRRGEVPILDGVSLAIASGETVALVGESGAGKSMLALAVMGLLPDGIRVARGSIALDGDELVGATPATIRAKRGGQMAMIFQDPLSSLHPAFRVGDQVAETLRAHGTCATKSDARARAVELLGLVGVPQPDARARDYPHQLSGGMRQRVMIAMAIANDPHLLIADEATTALDVTVQAQVLEVLRAAQQRTGAGLLLVTHDLGVVAGTADRVVVLYAGRVVEEGPVAEVLAAPAHPYTLGLMRAVPRLGSAATGAPQLPAIPGQPPNPGAWPSGCAFHPRCEFADEQCRVEVPALTPSTRERAVACHHPRPDPRGAPR